MFEIESLHRRKTGSWGIPLHNHPARPLYHEQIGTFDPVHPKLPSSEIKKSQNILISLKQSM